ncbi:MAG: hypothetical protein IJV01_03740 [Bacteroidales bacterium]|nr:hypothetical protein [Bacteroidales bacterium]
MRRWLLPLLCCAFLTCCCTPPAGMEEFIPASQAENDCYNFSLDLSDSLAYYDVILYTRSDDPKPEKDFVAIYALWYSPDSLLTHAERFALPTGGRRGKVSVYREDLHLRPGVWRLMLNHEPGEPSIRGIGLSLKKHENPYGTR